VVNFRTRAFVFELHDVACFHAPTTKLAGNILVTLASDPPLHLAMKSLLLFFLGLPVAFASPVKRASSPTVTISYPAATIVGSTGISVESFSGIPFAQPPTGSLRLKPPQPLTAPLGTVTATGTAKACPQFFFSDATSTFPTDVLGILLDTPLFQTVTNVSPPVPSFHPSKQY
jgi:hypothetical protein